MEITRGHSKNLRNPKGLSMWAKENNLTLLMGRPMTGGKGVGGEDGGGDAAEGGMADKAMEGMDRAIRGGIVISLSMLPRFDICHFNLFHTHIYKILTHK